MMYSLIKALIKMLMKNVTENEKTHKCVQKGTCATSLAIAFKEASMVTLYITFFFPYPFSHKHQLSHTCAGHSQIK